MAFFKFRKTSDEPAAAMVQPESIEAMRRRAKYRLAGAAVLVLIGVIGFPILFDRQPRPIAVDTPIEIPDKNKMPVLNIPAPAALPAAVATGVEPAASGAALSASAVVPQQTASQAEAKTAVVFPTVAASVPQAAASKASEPSQKALESKRVEALLNGQVTNDPVAAATARYVVQVGSFADAARAREVRLKLEQAGLKTYTQVANTKDGQRIRVRVGPFASRGQADKAAEKIKQLALPSAILSL